MHQSVDAAISSQLRKPEPISTAMVNFIRDLFIVSEKVLFGVEHVLVLIFCNNVNQQLNITFARSAKNETKTPRSRQ